jgi:hypothetical protein
MNNVINPKSINESLTESEFKEVKLNVEGMYAMMETIMRNWLCGWWFCEIGAWNEGVVSFIIK